MKKNFVTLLAVLVMSFVLSACGAPKTCKADGCSDEKIYKDGYCQYHYTINVAKEEIDEAGKNAFDSIFGK